MHVYVENSIYRRVNWTDPGIPELVLHCLQSIVQLTIAQARLAVAHTHTHTRTRTCW